MVKIIAFFNSFYKKYIYPYDPSSILIIKTIKGFIQILCTIALSRFLGPHAMIWSVMTGTVLLSIPGQGKLRITKLAILITGFAIAAVIPLATFLGNNPWTAAAFVFVLAFVSFYSAVLGPVYGNCAFWVALVEIIAVWRESSFEEGVNRCIAVLLGVLIAYLFRFHVPPRGAKRFVKGTFNALFDEISSFYKTLTGNIYSGDDVYKHIQSFQNIINVLFQRLEKIIGAMIDNPEGDAQRDLIIVPLYKSIHHIYQAMISLWIARFSTENNPLRNEIEPQAFALYSDIGKNLIELKISIIEQRAVSDMLDLNTPLKHFSDRLVEIHTLKKNEFSIRQWMEALNVLYAIKNLVKEIENAAEITSLKDYKEETPYHKPEKKGSNILSTLFSNLKYESFQFRHSLKVAIAATFGSFVANAISHDHGYWIALAIIFVMKPSIGGSIKTGKERLSGTLLGVVLAAIVVMIAGTGTPLYFLILFSGLFVLIYVRELPYYALKTTIMGFVIILMLSLAIQGGWKYGLLRIIDNLIGITIGLLVANFIWPSRAGKYVKNLLADVIDQECLFFTALYNDFFQVSQIDRISVKSNIEKKQKEIDATFNEMCAEPGISRGERDLILNIINTEKHIFDLLLSMESVVFHKKPDGIQDEIWPFISGYLKLLTDGFGILSRSLRDFKQPDVLSDYGKAFVSVIEEFINLKSSDKAGSCSFHEMLNVSYFLWHLISLMQKIRLLRDLIAEIP